MGKHRKKCHFCLSSTSLKYKNVWTVWTEDVDKDQHGSRNVFHNLYIYNYIATSPVKPFFWKRYVDDVISAVSGNKAERLLSHLNSVEPSIQFTLKREKDRHLPFLDLDVSRGVQGNLETRFSPPYLP